MRALTHNEEGAERGEAPCVPHQATSANDPSKENVVHPLRARDILEYSQMVGEESTDGVLSKDTGRADGVLDGRGEAARGVAPRRKHNN